MGLPVTKDTHQSVLPRGHATANLIRIHDLRSQYAELDVTGVGWYAERGLIVPGITVVHGTPASYLAYLRGVGIGAPFTGEVIIAPPANSLVERLSDATVARFRRLIGAGGAIEWFQPGAPETAFTEQRLRLPHARAIWGPSADLARHVNDKAWQRRFATGQQLSGVRFPEHTILRLSQTQHIYAATRDLLDGYGGAVLKLTNLANGEGMEFIHPTADWEHDVAAALATLRRYGATRDVIVEAAYFDHLPLSGQVEIGPRGARFIRGTLNQVKNGRVHDGNIVTSGSLPGVPHWAYEELRHQSLEYAEALRKLGYRGWVGFDFLLANGSLFMLEVNGRVTAALYPLSVGLQVEANGQSEWAVASTKIEHRQNLTYDAFIKALTRRRLLFNGRVGILPACPSLIHQGVAMLYAVAASAGEAQAHLAQAREMLRAS
jgi:hypothetical protein